MTITISNSTAKTNLMAVHSQWAKRRPDECFLSLPELHSKVSGRKASSAEHTVALDGRFMQVQPVDDSEHSELQLVQVNPNSGEPVRAFGELTHYSFGQLASKAKAPASYLRTLPPMIAAVNLQWSLEHNEGSSQASNDVKLLTRTNGHTVVAAATGPDYGRIYDAEITQLLVDSVDPTVWKVPAASYSKRDPKRATTLYASDHDVFVFLVNESAGIDVDGSSIKRGVIVWNSEVGAATFGICTFLYDYVCDNRIIWGASDVTELRIRHTAGGPHRFAAQAIPQLSAFIADQSTSLIESTIRRAKAKEVAQDKAGVTAWLKNRGFTIPQAKTAYEKAEQDPRGYNPRSVWGLVQGMTDAAHDITATDTRTDIERRAGKLLDIVKE